jgi:EpsI family protein
VLGWPVARVLIFPIGFLYFAMPAWSGLVTPLQALSIHVNSVLIWLTGLPAYISGDVVQVPAGTLEIAGGCGGRHSFVVGLTLAALYGELARDTLRWRLTWIGLMGLLALIANWVRIFVIVAAAVATDMQTFLVTVDHYWFGWGMFLLAFVGFLWIAGRLHGGGKVSTQSVTAVNSESSRVRWTGFVAMLFSLSVLPALGYATDNLRTVSGAIHIDWPAAPQGWQGPVPVTTSEWQPLFRNATLLAHQQYLDPHGQPVEVFVVAYRVQRQSAKLLAYRNTLFERDNGLRSVGKGFSASAVGSWREDTVVDASGQRSIIWSRYSIGAHAFVRPWLAQLWYGIAAMTSPALSSLTALRASCDTDCAAAREQLASAAAELQPALRIEALPKEQRSPTDGRGNSR